MKTLAASFLLIAAMSTPVWATQRTLTNKNGASIKAELVELKDQNGTEVISFTRVKDNRPFEIPLDSLSYDDQDAIRKWWLQELKDRQVLKSSTDLDIAFKYNRKKKSLGNSSWSDNDRFTYTPEVEIENDDLYNSFTGNKIRIVCFAEHTYYKGTLQVVSASEQKFDIPRNGTAVVSGNSYSFTNYESDWSNYEYGWEQAGYVIIIKNSKGDITHVETNEDKFRRNLDTVMKCSVDEYYSNDLGQKRSTYSN